MKTFPFHDRMPRPGEPPRPTNYPIDLGHDDIVAFRSHSYFELGEKWLQWAHTQPDQKLLIEDYFERKDWLVSRGQLHPYEIHLQRETRWQYAEEIRAAGHGEILTKYWSNSSELQASPPPFDWSK